MLVYYGQRSEAFLERERETGEEEGGQLSRQTQILYSIIVDSLMRETFLHQ